MSFSKVIRVSNGLEFIIDDIDYDLVSQYKWKIDKDGYVRRNISVNGKYQSLLLHREIIGAKKGEIVDHINGIKTDNRRENLRIATHQNNIWNRPAPSTNTSGYKGVSYRKDIKMWKAQINVNGKRVGLGHYDNPHDAARVYNLWAKDIQGEFAYLNKIKEDDSIGTYF